MPYRLVQSGNKYFVENKQSGRRYSKKSLSRTMAVRQMRALYASENGRSKKPLMGSGICWSGYHRVPGSTPYAKHSCKKKL
jgi:hypothetical protein